MRCPGCHADLPTPTDPTQRRVRCAACGKDAGLAAVAGFEGTIAVAPAAPATAPPDPLVGTSFAGGRYRIEALLGVGGMGRVYRATQTALGRAVAIKILSPELARDEQFRRRFDREAGTLASLDHPHIVAVHDMGVEDGTPYIVMAIVAGRDGHPVTLRQLLDAGPVEEDLCLRVIQQTCDALDYAHKKGIVHRDIKPANILLDAAGNAKIADFGIARAGGAEAAALTTTGAVLGTLKYMAPEQMSDSSRADPRSDLYSLGVVFYELLTGHAPVGRFELPSEERKGLDHRLDAIVDRALRRAADQRYQSADQMARDLSRITTERDLARLGGGAGGKAAPSPDREARLAPARAAATPAPGRAVADVAPAAPAAPRRASRGPLVAAGVVALGVAAYLLWPTSPKPSGPSPVVGGLGATPVPAMGEPAMGEPAMGTPAMGEPAMADPAMGEPAMGGPAMESTWATDMPTPEDPPPAMTTEGPLPPPEPEVVAHRATLMTLLLDDGLSAADVGSTRNAMAKSASSAKADLASARKAFEAALAALARADWDALDRALPETVVREAMKKAGTTDPADVRRHVREAYQDAAVRKAKVDDLVAVGADWALGSASGVDGDDDPVEAVALLVLEGGVWKVVLTW